MWHQFFNAWHFSPGLSFLPEKTTASFAGKGLAKLTVMTVALGALGAVGATVYALICGLIALPIELIGGSCGLTWFTSNVGRFALAGGAAGGAAGAITGMFGDICGRPWRRRP